LNKEGGGGGEDWRGGGSALLGEKAGRKEF